MASEWIRTFGPSRRVARINVSASEALNLLQVKTVGEGEQITNLFHLDADQGAELVEAIREALAALAAAPAETYAAVFAKTSGGQLWTVEDQREHRVVGPTWKGDGAQAGAERYAERLNAGEIAPVELSQSQAAPPRRA